MNLQVANSYLQCNGNYLCILYAIVLCTVFVCMYLSTVTEFLWKNVALLNVRSNGRI